MSGETDLQANNDPHVVTFGCRLNTYESEVMRAHAAAAGRDKAIIFNTCAVTGEAVRQARQAIRKARRDHPDAEIIVTGCAAQIDPESFGAMPEVDLILGNAEKMKAESFQRGANARVRVQNIFEATETAHHLVDGFEGRVRGFVEIQNGCDHRCTFCIIPYGRGNSRSVPAGEVVERIRHLVARGVPEIVLTGVDLTSYGADLPGTPKLGDLVRRILKLVPDLPRLRLSSLDTVEIDDALMTALADEERLMPHLHLSLQAGDDMILKRMKRRHAAQIAVEFCERARKIRPGLVFGADLIAGFPTETDEMFENTLNHVKDCGLTYLHVFPFSPREGTPAARMPQLPKSVIKARAAQLREAGEQALTSYLDSLIGNKARVLMENPHLGRTETYAEVRVDAPQETGAILDMLLARDSAGSLTGMRL